MNSQYTRAPLVPNLPFFFTSGIQWVDYVKFLLLFCFVHFFFSLSVPISRYIDKFAFHRLHPEGGTLTIFFQTSLTLNYKKQ